MNLLCPNCQKMLTVPEQYAGQMMKCPLCAGTFTVPGLPAAATPPPPPPVEPIPFQTDPVPPPAPPSYSQPATAPAPSFSPTPGFNKPVSSAPPWTPPPPPPPPGDYTKTHSAYLSPKVLQWIPAPALFLVFILSFFPWVGIYPGGVAAVTQNLWQAAFGYFTEDQDMKSKYKIFTESEINEQKELVESARKDAKAKDKKFDEDRFKVVDNRPGVSISLIFYLLLFLFTLVVTAGVTVVGLMPIKLPPAIQPFLMWRWAVVAGLNLLILLLLSLSLLFGFSLENRYADLSKLAIEISKDSKPNTPKVVTESEEGTAASADRQTIIFKFVLFLHLLALVVALLMLWLNQREMFGRPVPRFDLRL